jgi:hypothetical protein
VDEEITNEPDIAVDTTPPQVPILQPGDIIVVASIDGGHLVSNEGALFWVSPIGTRTIIAGA